MFAVGRELDVISQADKLESFSAVRENLVLGGIQRPVGEADADIARIHAPIGLSIGAVSPSEIAVSIMAEITAELRLPKETAKVQAA